MDSTILETLNAGTKLPTTRKQSKQTIVCSNVFVRLTYKSNR
jgi:hypothetical protein